MVFRDGENAGQVAASDLAIASFEYAMSFVGGEIDRVILLCTAENAEASSRIKNVFPHVRVCFVPRNVFADVSGWLLMNIDNDVVFYSMPEFFQSGWQKTANGSHTLIRQVASLEFDALVSGLETKISVGRGNALYKAVTGEPYVSMTSDGIKPEGAHYRSWYMSRGEAILKWYEAAVEYINGVHGDKKIYWRCKPEVVCRPLEQTDEARKAGDVLCRYNVFSRFLVSSHPDTMR